LKIILIFFLGEVDLIIAFPPIYQLFHPGITHDLVMGTAERMKPKTRILILRLVIG